MPQQWEGEGDPPKAVVTRNKGKDALGAGDRVLARLTKTKEEIPYRAEIIRKIGSGPQKILGIFRVGSDGGRLVPVDKREDREWLIPGGETGGAKDGELVEAEKLGGRRDLGLQKARIVERLGDPMAPKSVSLIAIHEHGIPDAFPDAAIAEAASAEDPGLAGREDLRHLPLVTIDPADARDHDDAIAALPDPDPANRGGWVLWVAIADVAHFVRSGASLDREARRRGNSTYFPDRVVPMLPDELSGDLCSLHEGVDRACIALEIRLAPDGTKRGHRFVRGLMRSGASLTYQEAQDAADGRPSDRAAELVDTVIQPLWNTYAALKEARRRRNPLDLDLPERRIELSEEGRVVSVNFRDRFDAHRLVEECMVLANVCAAETLEEKRRRFLYRVHEEPSPEKLKALREMAEGMGLTLAKGQVLKTQHLNKLLNDAAGSDHAEAVNITVLRSMMQAYYSPQPVGHFGLALVRYAHFTSPIRRYADLIVHRALISAHGWGKDGLTPEDEAMLDETATHISETERRSMTAERDTSDRYLSAYLADRIGTEFEGRISGVARFGLFVKLEETGADGIVPISTLGREYFRYEERANRLVGDDTGRVFALGMRATVRLAEAVPVTGGLMFELLDVEGKVLKRPPRGKGKSRTIKRARKGGRKR